MAADQSNRVRAVAKKIEYRLRPFSKKIEIAGSIRRKVLAPRDIDILVIPKDKAQILIALKQIGKITQSGPEKVNAIVDGVQVNVVYTNDTEWGAALMYFTGPKGANIWNRKLAQKLGYTLNQRGLFDRKTGKRIPVYTEKEIYQYLKKSYRDPEERGKPRLSEDEEFIIKLQVPLEAEEEALSEQ